MAKSLRLNPDSTRSGCFTKKNPKPEPKVLGVGSVGGFCGEEFAMGNVEELYGRLDSVS